SLSYSKGHQDYRDREHADRDLGHRQETCRPGRRRYPGFLSAGAIQGQGRSLYWRTDPAQGRQNRPVKMATNRKAARKRIHHRIRKTVSGTSERPRLAVHFSGRHVYAQAIDDDAGKTLATASTLQKQLAADKAAANRET